MRYLIAALLVAAVALAAHAQGMSGMGGGMSGMGGKGHHGQHQRDGDQPKRKVDEKAYKSALDKLPDKKFDPWGGVRDTSQPK
jgi:hypothetical protein